MARSKKTKRNKSTSRRRTFKKSRVPPKRKNVMRGGNVSMPATFSNKIASVSPQSYLPYNKFENDPGYLVVNSRNTGPFLSGVLSGGKRRTSKRRVGGSNGITGTMTDTLNTATNNVGIIPSPALNELSGVSGMMSGFSETGSAYSQSPVKIVPLA